jgi:hypothetical protein
MKKQTFEIGSIVTIGFMRGLKVLKKVPTPGDGAPDEFILTNGKSLYSFVPHHGLVKLPLGYQF